MTTLAALMSLYLILAGAVIPFGGFVVQGYRADPPIACPGIVVKLVPEVRFKVASYAKLTEYRVSVYWLNQNGGRTEAEIFQGPFRNYPKNATITASSMLPKAPSSAGLWRLVSSVRYEGKVLGWPRNVPSVTFTTTKPVLETRAVNDPHCKN